MSCKVINTSYARSSHVLSPGCKRSRVTGSLQGMRCRAFGPAAKLKYDFPLPASCVLTAGERAFKSSLQPKSFALRPLVSPWISRHPPHAAAVTSELFSAQRGGRRLRRVEIVARRVASQCSIVLLFKNCWLLLLFLMSQMTKIWPKDVRHYQPSKFISRKS